MEGDNGRQKAETYKSISIHSLRVEGDQIIRDVFGIVKISIHSLRVEGDRLI